VGQVYAEGPVRESGFDGVVKIVNVIATGFAPIAIVDPGVRVLMHEERHANSCEIRVAFITITITPQTVPGCRGNGMRRRSNCQQVENSIFAVGVPTRF
jgi:hypothetical protein